MFIIRQHSEDSDVVEIMTRGKMARNATVWTVVHIDFIHDAVDDTDVRQDILDILKSGEEVELGLERT